MTGPMSTPDSSLGQRLLAGDRRALARGITLIENDEPDGWPLLREVFAATGRGRVIGFTGPPGVGKSTLIGALTTHRREHDRTVGVLSVDPSSPFTRGALLGDRIRLDEHFRDPGVFIRSMANRGVLGGLSAAALQAVLLMDAAGCDDVLLETVGVGQAELAVSDHADTVVLVLMPGAGDAVQALKAGIMEIPDVVVVNKADRPQANDTVQDIRHTLALTSDSGWAIPVLCTQADRALGIVELSNAVDAHIALGEQTGQLAARRTRNLRREVVAIATTRLRLELESAIAADGDSQALLERVAVRELDPVSAAAQLLDRARSGAD